MIRNTLNRTRAARQRGALYLRRAMGGLTLIVVHEVGAVSGHIAEVRERMAVARKARGLSELVRDQTDLLAETRARLVLDQRERTALLNSWFADLRAAA